MHLDTQHTWVYGKGNLNAFRPVERLEYFKRERTSRCEKPMGAKMKLDGQKKRAHLEPGGVNPFSMTFDHSRCGRERR